MHSLRSLAAAFVTLALFLAFARAEESTLGQPPPAIVEPGAGVPRAWDPEALKGLELPITGLGQPPQVVPPEYYYKIPTLGIYKSYDVYRPDREPPDYWEWLLKQEPEIVWGATKSPKLETEEDWIKAGEIVFDAPVAMENGSIAGPYDTLPVRDPAWYEQTGTPLTAEGKLPFYRYVIRKKGKIELGTRSCGMRTQWIWRKNPENWP